jgi:3-phenylpropionate/trans-cinnamate dioxygenase ferredoxin reductase subunit
MNADAIVIVGGGHAAAALCAALAAEGQGARVHLVCDEPQLPYQRPPLSKGFIKEPDEAPQWHRDAAWYQAQGITVHAADPARSIDRDARLVVLASGLRLPYARLVLATGTRARTLTGLPAPLANVATLRTVADAQRLRGWIHAQSGGELLVLGGGFIGLEVAGTARLLGWNVKVLEVAPRLLARATSPALSAHILQHHRAMGTEVVLNAAVGDFRVNGDRLDSVQIDGAEVPVPHLLLSVGAVPEVALASAAGLAVDNGIRVDAGMRSSDPSILAIGDCTSFEYRGRWIRLESVQNANDQARVAAATLSGREATYQPTPFFWSDQGGMRLQMVGLWRDGLQAVRRNGPTDAGFSLFHYDGGVLVAVESVNAPIDHINARKLLEAGRSPPAAQVADPQVALKSLL